MKLKELIDTLNSADRFVLECSKEILGSHKAPISFNELNLLSKDFYDYNVSCITSYNYKENGCYESSFIHIIVYK